MLDAAYAKGRLVREGDPEWRDDVPVRVETIPVRRAGRVLGVVARNTNLLGVRTPSRLELSYLQTRGRSHPDDRAAVTSRRPGRAATTRTPRGSATASSASTPTGRSSTPAPTPCRSTAGSGCPATSPGWRSPRSPVTWCRPGGAPDEETRERGPGRPGAPGHRARDRGRLADRAGDPAATAGRAHRRAGAAPRRDRPAAPGPRAGHQGRDDPRDPPPGEEQPADGGGPAAPAGPAHGVPSAQGRRSRRPSAGWVRSRSSTRR